MLGLSPRPWTASRSGQPSERGPSSALRLPRRSWSPGRPVTTWRVGRCGSCTRPRPAHVGEVRVCVRDQTVQRWPCDSGVGASRVLTPESRTGGRRWPPALHVRPCCPRVLHTAGTECVQSVREAPPGSCSLSGERRHAAGWAPSSAACGGGRRGGGFGSVKRFERSGCHRAPRHSSGTGTGDLAAACQLRQIQALERESVALLPSLLLSMEARFLSRRSGSVPVPWPLDASGRGARKCPLPPDTCVPRKRGPSALPPRLQTPATQGPRQPRPRFTAPLARAAVL